MLHAYVLAPEAVNMVLVPWQKELAPEMVTLGSGLTVRMRVMTLSQPLDVYSVRVYEPAAVRNRPKKLRVSPWQMLAEIGML